MRIVAAVVFKAVDDNGSCSTMGMVAAVVLKAGDGHGSGSSIKSRRWAW